jgi:hypothetical protein
MLGRPDDENRKSRNGQSGASDESSPIEAPDEELELVPNDELAMAIGQKIPTTAKSQLSGPIG